MEDDLFILIGIGVLWVIPIILCMFIARSKRRKWYWFAPLGILSWAGVMIAGYISPPKPEPEATEDIKLASKDVRLTWGKPSVDLVSVDFLNVEIRLPYDSPLSDVQCASEALRLKAARVGANAVQSVEYFVVKTSWLTLNHERIMRAQGQAVRVWSNELSNVPCDAELLGEYMHMDDPDRVLMSALRTRGGISICWAIINSIMVYYQSLHLGPNERLVIPPVVIYLLSACMLIFGIVGMFKRWLILLPLHGLMGITIGVLNLVSGTYHLGIIQILAGLETGVVVFVGVINLMFEEYNKRMALLFAEDDEVLEDDAT